MNLERMAGMPESSAKGTLQTEEAPWKKESIGTSARHCLFRQGEPITEPWSWEVLLFGSSRHQDIHLLPCAMLAKQTQQGMYSIARSARLSSCLLLSS